MDTLETFGDHGAHAEQRGALGCPVAAGAGAIFLAGDDHQRRAIGLVGHGSIIDGELLARREVARHAPFDARHHFVADADVGEGAAHHHFMVAAARAIGVELRLGHLAFGQVAAGRARFLDAAGRADVIGGDAVPEHGQRAGTDDVGHRGGRHRHAVEVGRVLHVGGAGVPAISGAAFNLDRLPALIAIEHVGIARGKHLGRHVGHHHAGDFGVGRPDVLEVNRAIGAFADRFLGQILAHRAGQGIGNDQRRRSKVIGLHVR